MSVTSYEAAPSPGSSGDDFQCTEEELFKSFMEIVNDQEHQCSTSPPEQTDIPFEQKDLGDNNNVFESGDDELQVNTMNDECCEQKAGTEENESEPVSHIKETVEPDNSLNQPDKVVSNTEEDTNIPESQNGDKLDNALTSQSQNGFGLVKDSTCTKEGDFDKDLNLISDGETEKSDDVNHDSSVEKDQQVTSHDNIKDQSDQESEETTASPPDKVESDSGQCKTQELDPKTSCNNESSQQNDQEKMDPANQGDLQCIEHNIKEGIRKAAQVCDEINKFINLKRSSQSSDEILDEIDKSCSELSTVCKNEEALRSPENSNATTVESEQASHGNIPNEQENSGESVVGETTEGQEKSGTEKQVPISVKECPSDDSSSTGSCHQDGSQYTGDQEVRKKSVSDSLASSEGSSSSDAKSIGTPPGDKKSLINWEILNTAFGNPETDEDEGEMYESNNGYGGFGLVLDDDNPDGLSTSDSRYRSVSQSSTISESEFREQYQKQHSSASLNRKQADGVLCSGYLLKLGGTGITPKNWRKRWCILRQDHCLYYYKTVKDKVPCGIVVLTNYVVSRSSEFHKKNCLKISKGGGRTYFFCSETSADMLRWMDALRKAADVVDEGTNFEIRKEIIHNVAIPALSIKKPDCHGFLTKQGGKNRNSWKRRYCVLKNGCLYYYREMADTTALGVAKLHGYKLEEVTLSGKRNVFRAVPPSSGMRIFSFFADNEYDKRRWIPCLEQSIQSHSTSS